ITASHEEREIMLEVVHRCAEEVFIPLTVGGGVTSIDDMRRLLRAGADKVSVNTSAVQDPDLITAGAREFGTQCIVLAIDAKESDGGAPESKRWEIHTHGGRTPTGMDAIEWCRRGEELGAGEITVNSIDRDGTQDGYDVDLLRAINNVVTIPVVASGGAGKTEHFSEAITSGGADAVLAASLFHFGQLTLREVKQHLLEKGIPVRL
ncbi:MAG: imidazole glycerol phosphate synthase subunit HisF, partial [Acidimicrobiia bacterium]